MKVLILGGNGMAGHALYRYYRELPGYDVQYTSRNPADSSALHLEALNLSQADHLLEMVRPDVVINAIGVLNQQAEDHERVANVVNGLLPHWIAGKLDELGDGGKLVHISTDCVFSGERGDYKESDEPDGMTVYARTKAAGEVIRDRHLTIRTSIIGPEIRSNGIGLLHWFLKQSGTVYGYTGVLWNGVTTLQLAKSIDRMLLGNVSGLYHLTAPEKVSKCELLHRFADVFGKRDVRIIADDRIRLDRTLACTRTDYRELVPDYDTMLAELRDWMWRS